MNWASFVESKGKVHYEDEHTTIWYPIGIRRK